MYRDSFIGEWGVGSGEWGVGKKTSLENSPFFPYSPLPTPHSPLKRFRRRRLMWRGLLALFFDDARWRGRPTVALSPGAAGCGAVRGVAVLRAREAGVWAR